MSMEPNRHMDIKRVVDNGNPPKSFRTLEMVAVTLAVVLMGAFFYFHSNAPVGGQPVAADVKVDSPATYTEPMTLKSDNKTFSISALGANPAQAITVGAVTKYIDAFTNTDVTETKQSDRMKEDIILKKPGHPATFAYQIDVAPYDVVKDGKGNLVFYQKGHSGDSNFWRFEIPAPVMIDAKGKKSTVSDIESTLTTSGILTVRPSAAWLASAAYPVDLDPTIIFFRAGIPAPPFGFTTPALMNGSSVYAYMRSVTVNSTTGKFVAVGCNSSNYPVAAYSIDGTIWTTPALMNGSSAVACMYAVTVNSTTGKFVAVGVDVNNYPVAAYSTDGTTWTTPALMNGSSVGAYMRSVTVNSAGKFVAVGFDVANNYPVAAYSTDGTTWTTPAKMNGSSVLAQMFSVTVNSAGKFVAVGGNQGSDPLAAYSTDGTTWTTPVLMNGVSGLNYRMFSVTVNSAGKFVAIGNDGSNYPLVAYSNDGSNWSSPTKMNGSSVGAYMLSVTVNSAGKFVAVGYNSSYYPVVAYSTDGTTWTTPVLMNGSSAVAYMSSVTVNLTTGIFVAVGRDGSTYPLYATTLSTSPTPTVPTIFRTTPASPAVGQQAYTTPGTYSWTAPAGVTSVSVVAVGAGTKLAGSLAYKNGITVIPGNVYTVVVPPATFNTDGYAYFIDIGTVSAGSGGPTSNSTHTGDGGGNGNASIGGGAGGYSGNGGSGNNVGSGGNGTGGAGGGGGQINTSIIKQGGGGGVGLLGQGSNGSGGSSGYGGGGGSSGSNGGNSTGVLPWGDAGTYGGGVGMYFDGAVTHWGNTSSGAVRIIWPGNVRQFPSTRTADETTAAVLGTNTPTIFRIPAGVPGAPTIGTATQTGATTATVAFTAPANNGRSTITTYTAYPSSGSGSGTLSQAGSGTINVTGLTPVTSYTFTVRATNSIGQSVASSASNSITTSPPTGQVLYSGTDGNWTAPAGVTSVSVVVVGSGGDGSSSYGGCGGGLGYINNYSVTPGNTYAYASTFGADSYFVSTATVKGGKGGTGVGRQGTYTGTGGGNGGNAGFSGGGAGGYAGNGGDGTLQGAGVAGSGGSGGGGAGTYQSSSCWYVTAGASGGGVGVLGQGASGSSAIGLAGGNGGSSGGNGSDLSVPTAYCAADGADVYRYGYGGATAGLYGGGGGGGSTTYGTGAKGAVRIIWPGNARQFPSTRTADE